MGGAADVEHARLRESPGIASVGLHLARPRRIHRGEVRIRDSHLVAEGLETPSRHPFAVGGGLDQHAGAGPSCEHGGEAGRVGSDPLLDDLSPLGEDTDLAFPLVHVDANLVHGWPPSPAPVSA